MDAGGAWPGFETGPGCGGRGRRRGLAGLQDRSHRAVRLACGDHAGRPPPTDATHGRIKQPGPTDTRHQLHSEHQRPTTTTHRHRPLPPPTDATHGRIKQPGPTDTRHQTRATRHAPGTPAGPQPQTRQSGPEPLGSGPPSILSDYRRHAAGGATRQVIASAPPQSAVSSARPPCRPCRSSRR